LPPHPTKDLCNYGPSGNSQETVVGDGCSHFGAVRGADRCRITRNASTTTALFPTPRSEHFSRPYCTPYCHTGRPNNWHRCRCFPRIGCGCGCGCGSDVDLRCWAEAERGSGVPHQIGEGRGKRPVVLSRKAPLGPINRSLCVRTPRSDQRWFGSQAQAPRGVGERERERVSESE
jgi:hypothetical protein